MHTSSGSVHPPSPDYIIQFCRPVSSLPGRSGLRSTSHGELIIPRKRTKTFGDRSFTTAGPKEWNALPLSLRDLSQSVDTFKKHLRLTYFFHHHVARSERQGAAEFACILWRGIKIPVIIIKY